MGNWVDYRTDHGVAFIILRDPPVNAYTLEMLQELDQAIVDVRFDDSIQVVILTGHGDNYFCAGANIPMLREVDSLFRKNFFLYASETFSRIERTPKFVIAALNGHAVGGGFELSLACDLRVAWGDNGTIGMPQISLGLIPGSGGTQRLTRMVGKGVAMQLLAEGKNITFDRARDLGLVNYVWRTDSYTAFMDRVTEYARSFTGPKTSTIALGKLKMAVQAGYELSIDGGLLFEQEALAQTVGTHDAQEGLDAWLDKRPPSFDGE